MPDLNFNITSVEPVPYAAAPALAFKLRVTQPSNPATPVISIHNIMLQCQVRLEPARRRYTPAEQSRLLDLFGEPSRWGQTVRSTLWTNAAAAIPSFTDSINVDLIIPCTFDFNIASTKYFNALDDGLVPLSFLFSGTIFYAAPDESLQIAQISWEKEASFSLPVPVWKKMMEIYYPNSAWLVLQKETFDRLASYKTRTGLPTWEAAFDRLLQSSAQEVEA